jgi:hypothetical protein
MPYSKELNREYTDEEARLWREVQHIDRSDTYRPRVVKIARGDGIHEERARQYVRTWSNDDLVRTIDISSGLVTLTPFGRRFTFEERYGDIEP